MLQLAGCTFCDYLMALQDTSWHNISSSAVATQPPYLLTPHILCSHYLGACCAVATGVDCPSDSFMHNCQYGNQYRASGFSDRCIQIHLHKNQNVCEHTGKQLQAVTICLILEI